MIAINDQLRDEIQVDSLELEGGLLVERQHDHHIVQQACQVLFLCREHFNPLGLLGGVVRAAQQFEVDVREHVREVRRVAVVRIAVEQQHRRADVRAGAQEIGEQCGIGTPQTQIRIAESRVELERQTGLESLPQDVAEEHLVVQPTATVGEPSIVLKLCGPTVMLIVTPAAWAVLRIVARCVRLMSLVVSEPSLLALIEK